MTLLAFEDISNSTFADLVENSQKVKVASEVNHQLLRAQSKDTGKKMLQCIIINVYIKDSKISTLIKMLLWSQTRLKEIVNFPIIKNLTTSEFSNQMSE